MSDEPRPLWFVCYDHAFHDSGQADGVTYLWDWWTDEQPDTDTMTPLMDGAHLARWVVEIHAAPSWVREAAEDDPRGLYDFLAEPVRLMRHALTVSCRAGRVAHGVVR
mgnify:CR=1 FL=1